MIEKITFQGGLNFDDDERVMPQGDYRNAVNCRIGITEDGNNFSVTNTRGNTLVGYTLPAGNNKTIGAYTHTLTSTVTYFNHNDLGQHHILQYSWVTGVITKVLQTPLLNFDINHKITGINIIDGLLLWTDGFDEPKKINIQKAISGGYGTFDKEYSYAIKQPPLYPPTSQYFTDTTKSVNYLNNFLFQFKYRFYYDDFEKSAFSPISTVPIPLLDASTFSSSLVNNRIDIVINTGSPIVTKIEIAGRIGNSGDFFSIVVIDKADKYDPIANSTTHTYLFYNDGNYSNVNLLESDKLFDFVPLLAKGQDFIDPTRITYGGVTEGFDPVDVVAKLNATVAPQPNTVVYNIHGTVRIRSPFTTYTDANSKIYSQPIYCNGFNNGTQSGPFVFGGFTHPPGNSYQMVDPTSYQQTIPLGGFVFYLAGTNYYGVSVQKNALSGILVDINGVYVLRPIAGAGLSDINFVAAEVLNSSVYSDVTIKNIPEGRYVLRVADHNTTQSELSSNDMGYQRRSTNTVKVGDAAYRAGVPNYYEMTIEIVNGTVSINNGSFTAITGSTIEIGESLILDLINSNYNVATPSSALSGYVIDHDTTLPTSATTAELYAETSVELAKVNVTMNSGFISNHVFSNYITQFWSNPNPKVFTDHNGYFFYACTNANSSDYAKVVSIESGAITPNYVLYSLAGGTSGYSYSPGATCNRIFVRTSTQGDLDLSRTIINGQFDDLLGPLKGISLVVTRGRFTSSAPLGGTSMTVYADTWIGSTRNDFIFYDQPGLAIAQFTPLFDQISIGLGISSTPQTNFNTPYNQPTPYNFAEPLKLKNVFVVIIGKQAANASLKRAGWYQYGIVYYDHGNRSGVTNSNDFASTSTSYSGKTNLYGLKLYVPFYTEKDSSGNIFGGGAITVDWSIYHRPPEWATHYQWVRTLNTANNRFLQFLANRISYVDNNGANSTFTSGTKIKIEFTNINDFNKLYPNSTLAYSLIKKPSIDHVRLIKDTAGNFFNQYIDLEILDYDGKYIYIENRPGLPDLSVQNGMLFEIYNPKLQAPSITWEIGECFEVGVDVNGVKYHKGPTGDQSTNYSGNYNSIPISSTPATGVFRGGDTYYRLRNMPYFGNNYHNYFIEDASVSDFYLSQIADIGRPNRIDPDYKRVERPSTIYYSELYVPETKINNLNSFYDTNFETYEQKYGFIKKLYNENHRLIVFQELKVGQIPVNQNIVYDNTGKSQIYSVEKVLNDIIYYAGEYGMTNPESFAIRGGSKYWADSNRFVPLRLSNAGVDPISENESKQIKMRTYFTEKLALYQKTSNAFIYGTFDDKFNDYVLAFERLFIPEQTVISSGGSAFDPSSGISLSVSGSLTIPETEIAPGETIVFDEGANRWRSKFEFLPDFMASANEGMISFYKGQLFVHNDNPVYNNFYGTQYESEIDAISHINPSKVKILQAISEETPDQWGAVITNESGQQATVYDTDFELKEGLQYAPIGFDENTPNVAEPGIEGDVMKDTSFKIKLTNALTRFTKLFAINTIYADSERSNK